MAGLSSSVAATLAGCAVASQQQVADHRHTGSEDQPWTEHQEVDRGHVRLPPCALGGIRINQVPWQRDGMRGAWSSYGDHVKQLTKPAFVREADPHRDHTRRSRPKGSPLNG